MTGLADGDPKGFFTISMILLYIRGEISETGRTEGGAKMPLEYVQQVESLRELSIVWEEHIVWYNAVLRAAMYPDLGEQGRIIQKPESLIPWITKARETKNLEQAALDHIHKAYNDLYLAGDQLLFEAATDQKPGAALFDSFTSLFEIFSSQLGHLEKNYVMEGSGLDPVTGLRSKTVLQSDMERELERFSRQGTQFTLAIARIDDYEKILESYGREKTRDYIKLVAEKVQKSLRSFDDAYSYKPDTFVLSLKQSDINGGIRALERLRAELEAENIILDIGGEKVPLTMSCCIAEPMPGDEVEQLLANLDEDLNTAERRPDSVLQYQEMSPLQRYVQNTE